ncbi:MAG: restriction endonuclease subunit S [Bacteroidales bacterium]|nr:restriction endonuclease subunit S [Bacteroidales bacterium]
MNASKTQWVRLGDYIEEQTFRVGNIDHIEISGINIEKGFIPTVANMTDVDICKYKLVPYGYYACNLMHVGRDVTIPLAYNNSRENLAVSPAYYTFHIKDEKRDKILPEYLEMVFSREEFGRLAWFHTDGSIRGNLLEKDFKDILVSLPTIEVQQELVDTYNGLKSLAEQNEALIEPLSNACQAFIVDCKNKYPLKSLGEYIEEYDKRNTEKLYTLDDVRGISTDKVFIPTKANMDGVSLTSYKIVNTDEFAYVADTSRRGDKIALALNSDERPFLISSIYTVFRSKNVNDLRSEYLYLLLSRSEFDRYARFNSWGSARETFDWEELCRVQIPLPPIEVQHSVVNLYHCMEVAKRIASEARRQIETLCPALLQRAANL